MTSIQKRMKDYLEQHGLAQIADSGMVPCFLQVLSLYLEAQAGGNPVIHKLLEDNVQVGTSLLRHYHGQDNFQAFSRGIERLSTMNMREIERLKSTHV